MLLANLLNLGVPAANVFFVGGKCVSPRIALIASIRIWGALVIVGAIVSIFFILGFSESFFRGIPKHVFWIALAVFPITLLYTFLASILQGQQDFRRYNTTQIIPALVSLLAALILVCTMRFGVIGATLSWGLGQIAGLAGSLLLLRTCWVESKEEHVGLSVPPPYMSRCLSYGWKAHLSNLISFLNYRADLFLVNFFLGPAGAGVYSVAIQLLKDSGCFHRR
jgi:O-antigen/teichoic acid export membrane protein